MEELLKEVGDYLEGWIKDRIQNKKFSRPNKIGGIIRPSPRKIYGSGNLLNSVSVSIEDDEIIISMLDYGADILFGEGRRAQPKFISGQKPDIVGIPPLQPIRTWMRTVPSFQGLSQKKLNSISYGIAINITKRGIGALDLFNEPNFEDEVFNTLESSIDEILRQEKYQDLGLDVQDIIDNIILLSDNSLEIIQEG